MTAEESNEPVPHPAMWGVLYRSSMPFWESVKNHQLRLQRCRQCQQWLVPPRPMCPNCLSPDSEWERVSGHGTIYSWVTYPESPHPAFSSPHTVILVELDEGPRLISNPVGLAPEELEIGMPVEVLFDDVDEDLTLFKFMKAA